MLSLKSLVERDVEREKIEEWCRSQARSVSIPGDPPLMLSRVLGKHLMYTLARDSALTPHLAMNGIWEPWVTMAIARHLKPGMRCIDVGACYGYYSVLMADLVGPTGAVDAWEPVHHDLLRTNRNVNGFGDFINVLPYAMGTRNGQSALMVGSRQDDLGLFNAGGARSVDSGAGVGVLVDVHDAGTFDADFIKIDVEGSEADVWQALEFQLRGGRVTVCMEFTPHKHQVPEAFLVSVQEMGFDLRTIASDGSTPAISIEEAVNPDTGDFRMLWLEKK